MVFSISVAKGLIQVLRKYRSDMKLEQMREEISSHPDLKNGDQDREHFLNSKGHSCIFLLKFHCDLNSIERCWGQAKRYTQAHCNYTIAGRHKNIPQGLDCVTVENVRNYYRKTRYYMFGNLQGVSGGPELETLVKMKTSHCEVGVNE